MRNMVPVFLARHDAARCVSARASRHIKGPLKGNLGFRVLYCVAILKRAYALPEY